MKRKVIIVWLGGVLIPSTAELTLLSLGKDFIGETDFELRQAIRHNAGELSLGRIHGQEYCERIIGLTGIALATLTLEEKLLEKAALRMEVMDLLKELPAKIEFWLLSDIPESWLRRIPGYDHLIDFFSRDHMLLLPEFHLSEITPGLFSALERKTGRTLEECILIDPDSKRAVEATKRGLSGVIYVYPQHLEHEFSLRKLIHSEADVLHPHGSGRVTR